MLYLNISLPRIHSHQLLLLGEKKCRCIYLRGSGHSKVQGFLWQLDKMGHFPGRSTDIIRPSPDIALLDEMDGWVQGCYKFSPQSPG